MFLAMPIYPASEQNLAAFSPSILFSMEDVHGHLSFLENQVKLSSSHPCLRSRVGGWAEKGREREYE